MAKQRAKETPEGLRLKQEIEHIACTELVYVMDSAEVQTQLDRFPTEARVALDFETTGFDPINSLVRLSTLYHPDVGVVIFDHMFCGSFEQLWEDLAALGFVVYNAKFEARWFDHFNKAKGDPVDIVDVDFIAKAVIGGYPSSLAIMVKRDLGFYLDKEEQASDWSKPRLTQSQLTYAAMDAVVTYYLYDLWSKKYAEMVADFEDPMLPIDVFNRAVLPTLECEMTGMVLDVDKHIELIKVWEMKKALCEKVVRRYTPVEDIANIGSDKQISDYLKANLPPKVASLWERTDNAKADRLKLDSKTLETMALKSQYPFSRWCVALRRFKYYRKYLSTYGETLVNKQDLDGRITYRLNIGLAATGRYSSSSINIQNIPRKPVMRGSFLPPHGFDTFVIADYSSIELRVLAEISNDEQLLHDVVFGNVHAEAACQIYRRDFEEFMKAYKAGDPRTVEQRYVSKAFNFQLTYGAMAPSLSLTLKCSPEEAQQAIDLWAERYGRAYQYRYNAYEYMRRTGSLSLVDGRHIRVFRRDQTVPVASNYGVQGAAGSCMLRAMEHVYTRRNYEFNPNQIAMVATVHDELILATHSEYVEPAKKLLTDGMIEGYLDVFPGAITDKLVEAHAGPTWASAK